MKTIKPKKPSKTEFFVVAWADYDQNSDDQLAVGTLSDIFSTKKKAQNAVMRLIVDQVTTDMEMYEKSEWKEVFGSEDPKEVAAKSIRENTGNFVSVEHETYRSLYTIDKFDLKFIK